MNLQHIIFQYLVEEETRPSLEDPVYNAAEDARDAAEQELKSALTGKQRRLLTEFRKREDELSLMQLRHMLSHCTLCLSAGGHSPDAATAGAIGSRAGRRSWLTAIWQEGAGCSGAAQQPVSANLPLRGS